MKQWIVLLLMVFMILGCVKPSKRAAQFIPEEYASYEGEGTARICGQVFQKTADGKQEMAVGDPILLAPVTSYSAEAVEMKIERRKVIESPDPRAIEFERHQTTDTAGQFCFQGLPSGTYYVIPEILLVKSKEALPVPKQAYGQATVKDNESIFLLLTR